MIFYFCRYVWKSKVVRIGGRSRDVEMEEISLKSLARNDTFTFDRHGKRKKIKNCGNDDMKFEIFSELDGGRTNIKINFNQIMNYHHNITYDQIFKTFTLEQVRFLIYNFRHRDGSFIIKNADNEAELVTHESVQSLKLDDDNVRNSTFVKQIKNVIIGCWLPRKSQFDNFETDIMKSVVIKKEVCNY